MPHCVAGLSSNWPAEPPAPTSPTARLCCASGRRRPISPTSSAWLPTAAPANAAAHSASASVPVLSAHAVAAVVAASNQAPAPMTRAAPKRSARRPASG
jgi:hypothetical protein